MLHLNVCFVHVRGIRCADAIENGEICPFYKGGLSPSLFLPEIERWGVSLSAESMFCEAKLLSLLTNVSDQRLSHASL